MLQLKHKTVFDSVSNTGFTPNLTTRCCTISELKQFTAENLWLLSRAVCDRQDGINRAPSITEPRMPGPEVVLAMPGVHLSR